ncbi:biotin/lipoyl-containing protein [Peptoniphilus sp.]|jgi:biotin carboxyl carrier protein|uniref:biotin/lipoyl-containing protein n=1 Tax=Peptoniphilus sp. TaxID=1971214 RepID=UPI003D92765B
MKYQVKVDGKVFEVEVEKIDGGLSSLQPGNLTQAAPVMQAPAAPAAPVQQAAPAPAPAAPAPAPAAAPAGGAGDVVAPMPGTVLKLAVADGAQVKAGDTVLILEAMKMENEISAPCDGTVTFNVKAGETVDTDAVLASIG